MSRKRVGQKKIHKSVAVGRIRYLFDLAEHCALQGNLVLSDRYVILARKISMKYLVPLPPEFKHRFCTHCYRYLLPPVTCRVRIHRGIIITYCHSCGKLSRIPLHGHASPTRRL